MSNNRIHSTAIVDPDISLDQVTVGPRAIIEKNVTIGKGTSIGAGTVIKENTIIGENNTFCEYCIIGQLPQDISFDATIKTGVKIGNNNTFREMVTINRASQENSYTTIGNNCFFMAVVHAAHDVIVGDNVVIANNSPLGGFVRVDDNAFISANCAIHQFVRIGRNSMMGGLSKPALDVPPFVTVLGNPASYRGLNILGMKRSGFSIDDRKDIKHIYKIIIEKHSTISAAIKELEQLEESKFSKEIIDFINSSKRGIISKRN